LKGISFAEFKVLKMFTYKMFVSGVGQRKEAWNKTCVSSDFDI